MLPDSASRRALCVFPPVRLLAAQVPVRLGDLWHPAAVREPHVPAGDVVFLVAAPVSGLPCGLLLILDHHPEPRCACHHPTGVHDELQCGHVACDEGTIIYVPHARYAARRAPESVPLAYLPDCFLHESQLELGPRRRLVATLEVAALHFEGVSQAVRRLVSAAYAVVHCLHRLRHFWSYAPPPFRLPLDFTDARHEECAAVEVRSAAHRAFRRALLLLTPHHEGLFRAPPPSFVPCLG